jgi:hypothetical protein
VIRENPRKVGGEVLFVGGGVGGEMIEMIEEPVTDLPLNEALTMRVVDPATFPAVKVTETPVVGFTLPKEPLTFHEYEIEVGQGLGEHEAVAAKLWEPLAFIVTDFGVRSTPLITGTTAVVIVMSEVACLEPPLRLAVTVRAIDPAWEPAVKVEDMPMVEERFPRLLLVAQV